MDITISPGILSGTVNAIPSKSIAHRMLICAALADTPTQIVCHGTSSDIDATVRCLEALGAKIHATTEGFEVIPIRSLPAVATLPCGESGSTIRFLLPIVGALGVRASFHMEGRLSQRPLSPLWEEMERMGCHLEFQDTDILQCNGKLRPGNYRIPGNVSSQFISGLLMALPLLEENSTLDIIGPLESKPYVDLTLAAMDAFGIHALLPTIPGKQQYCSRGRIEVEGDWSNAAFWITAGALNNPVSIVGLTRDSLQGDRAITDILPLMNHHAIISAAQIPDLIPILAVFAAVNTGAVFTDIRRLRLKESDRVAAICAMINALGGKATATENTLTIHGTGLKGGIVNSCRDHRIAMAAAIASTVCIQPVTILDAECVNKSYPGFWDDFTRLGGKYEFYLR